MDQSVLFTVLDRSIAKVADIEFRQLSRGLGEEAVAIKVGEALDALGGLQQGNPPDYRNPWVALFYLTWYQPGHIRLAHDLILSLGERKDGGLFTEAGNTTLRVVDFGCGALAMLFGISWIVADAIEQGADVECIRVDSYDTGDSMIKLGIGAWNQFKDSLSNIPDLHYLRIATKNLVQPEFWGSDPTTSCSHSESTEGKWLTAMHTVYRESLDPTKQKLGEIATRFTPDVGLFTCHADRGSLELLDQASPLQSNTYHRWNKEIFLPSAEVLNDVTQWRRKIAEEFTIDHRFLSRNVTWGCSRASALMSVRR